MPLTCSIPLEMCPIWLFCIGQWDQTYTSSEIEVDPADYPGMVGARFEVILDNTWWTDPVDQPIRLIDDVGTVYAEILFPPETYHSGTFGDSHLRMSVGFTLAPVKTKYYLQIICADIPNWGTLEDFRCARIWIDVVDSERVRIQVPLIEGDQSSGGGLYSPEENDQWSWFIYTGDWQDRLNHDTFEYAGWDGDGTYWWNIFLLEKTKWATVDHWTFEVTGAQLEYYPAGPSEGDPIYDQGILHVAIFNKTKNVMVAGTELTFTEIMPTRKTIDFTNSAVNWDDGDEFEVRMKCPYTGLGGYARYGTLGCLYRCVLYCTLDPATKAQIYLKAGAVVPNMGTAQESRILYEPDKYPINTKAYLESTIQNYHGTPVTDMSRQRSAEITSLLASNHRYIARSEVVAGVANIWLEEAYFADAGNYAWYKFPGSATVITNGSLYDTADWCPAGYTGWVDKDGLLQDDNVLARIQLNVANDTAIIELGDFHFDAIIPPGTNIVSISLVGIFACIGPPQWVDDYQPTMGAGTPLNAYVDAVPYLGGVIQGSWVAQACANWFLLNPSWAHFDMYYPQNAYTQPVPVFWPLSGGGTFSFRYHKIPWLLSDLVNANFKIRVRVRVPSSARFTQFEFCWCRAWVNAYNDIAFVSYPVDGNITHGNTFIILEFEGNVCVEEECIFSFPDPNSELPR